MAREEPLLPLYQVDTHRSSVYSMQELEPSPVEETPVNPDGISEKLEGGYFPPTRSTTNSLGVRSSRIPQVLLAIQKYSTIPFATYLVMHYTNTALIPLTTLSIQSAESSLLLTRPYYQSFPIEPLLVYIPLATHVFSGLALRLYRRRQAAKKYGAETYAERQKITRQLWPKVSTTSLLGYMLSPLVIGHVIVNRITPLKVDGDSTNVGLRYFSYGLNKHRWLNNVGYAIVVSVASYHLVGGAAKYLKVSREYVTEGGDYGASKRRTRTRLINALSTVMAGVWIAGGLGVIGRGVDGAPASAWEIKAWDNILSNVPIIGAWL